MMKKMIFIGILALSAVFFASEKSRSTPTGSSNVAGWFESGTENGNGLAFVPIPPILWPDPPRPPKAIDLQEAVIG